VSLYVLSIGYQGVFCDTPPWLGSELPPKPQHHTTELGKLTHPAQVASGEPAGLPHDRKSPHVGAEEGLAIVLGSWMLAHALSASRCWRHPPDVSPAQACGR
jgi:hypothetical protein